MGCLIYDDQFYLEYLIINVEIYFFYTFILLFKIYRIFFKFFFINSVFFSDIIDYILRTKISIRWKYKFNKI